MKITLLTPALVAILGLALASTTVSAQTTNAPAAATTAKTSTAKATEKQKYGGTITAISATSVTVVSTKKTRVLAITPATTFVKDKAPATAADFAVGDKVFGQFTDTGTALTAFSLKKSTPKTATKPAAPAAQ